MPDFQTREFWELSLGAWAGLACSYLVQHRGTRPSAAKMAAPQRVEELWRRLPACVRKSRGGYQPRFRTAGWKPATTTGAPGDLAAREQERGAVREGYLIWGRRCDRPETGHPYGRLRLIILLRWSEGPPVSVLDSNDIDMVWLMTLFLPLFLARYRARSARCS